MKERFELVYYIVFMILGVGGLGAYIIELFEPYWLKYIGIAFSMTLGRFIYNGKHFWNPPMEIPEDLKIQIIIIFIVVSVLIVALIENFYFF